MLLCFIQLFIVDHAAFYLFPASNKIRFLNPDFVQVYVVFFSLFVRNLYLIENVNMLH